MKHTKRVASLVLVLALLLGLSTGALAKTASAKIDDPAGEALVFSVNVGDLSVRYTWDDIGGRNAFASVTKNYGAKDDNEQHISQPWTGIPLTDILKDVETRTGVKLEDDYKVSPIFADSYVMTPISVATINDPDENFIVAQDPLSNSDGDTKYENTYVRILRGTDEEMPNTTMIRCVLGLEIRDAEGKAIATPKAKAPGGDADNAYFYIAVKESANSPFKMYYYTLEELRAFDDIHSFTYSASNNTTTKARGVYLQTLIDNLTGVEVKDDMIIQYAEQDGFHADQNKSVDESAFKDLVSWLGESHVDADGVTQDALNTVIAYETSSGSNVYTWAEEGDSNFLRAYKQRPETNSATYKMLMGVVISYDGRQLSGKDGYSLTALSSKNEGAAIKEYPAVTGLVPGMEYVVRAPQVTNGTLAAGQPASKKITVGEGTSQKITFVYDEAPYFTVKAVDKITEYVFTDFLAEDLNAQAPSVEDGNAVMTELGGSVYGYNNAMLYRYYGVYLSDFIEDGVTGKITVYNGEGSIEIDAEDAGDYFVAYGSSQSARESNTAESRRSTTIADKPFIIKPSDEMLVCVDDNHKLLTDSSKDSAPAKVITGVTGISYGEQTASHPFTDLGNYAWAEEAISYLFANKIVNGTSATEFSPANSLKRGDFILMLYRAYDLGSYVDGIVEPFRDVLPDSYYFGALHAAKALGIAKGDGVNFSPESTITRQDAMTLIYRTLSEVGIELTERNDLGAFADADSVADYALEAIEALVAAGVINGKDGKIAPADNMNRAEMAVSLYRALVNLG